MEIETEEIDIEKSTRIKRSLKQIIEFVNGYSINYCFAIPENFKPAFDIKLTYRVIKRPAAEPPGFIKKKELVYTQGKYYSFDEGDIFYDSKEAYYGDWQIALRKIKCSLQIKEASSAYPELIEITLQGKKKYRYNPGRVEFILYKPDHKHSRLIENKTYECTQESFVILLKSGVLKTLDKSTIKLL